MNRDDIRAERQALRTRAATLEAQRQRALQRRDWRTAQQCEADLRRLWARHEALTRHNEADAQ